MRFLEIGLLIFMLIQLVIVRHWLDKVYRGIVSQKKFNVVLFQLTIILVIDKLISHLRFGSNPIPLICYGVFAGFILIHIVNLKTNDSEECKEDFRILEGYIVLLTFGTGLLALVIHDPAPSKEGFFLVGLIAIIFYSMFVQSPR